MSITEDHAVLVPGLCSGTHECLMAEWLTSVLCFACWLQNPKLAAKTVTLRSTQINFDMLLNNYAPPRKTRIAVTIGPSSR
jgi:hypothetical protein